MLEVFKDKKSNYKKKEKSNKPKLIYKTDGIVEKILIDLSCKKLEKVVFDDKEELEKFKGNKSETDTSVTPSESVTGSLFG